MLLRASEAAFLRKSMDGEDSGQASVEKFLSRVPATALRSEAKEK
jgi:hypothetical protein